MKIEILVAAICLLIASAVCASERQEVMYGLTQDELVQVTVCGLEATASAYEKGAIEAARVATDNTPSEPLDADALEMLMLRFGASAMFECMVKKQLPIETARIKSCYAIRIFLTSEIARLSRRGDFDLDKFASVWEKRVSAETRPLLRNLIRSLANSEKDEARLGLLRFGECVRFPESAPTLLAEIFEQ